MVRRYLNKRSNTYVIKDRHGKFVGNITIKRSMAADKARRARHRPRKRGQGNTGDWGFGL